MSAFGGPQIVSDGLLIYYDAANPRSYVGSATSCFDLSGFNNTGNLSSGISFSSGERKFYFWRNHFFYKHRFCYYAFNKLYDKYVVHHKSSS